ncbi:PhzF family phenazine biosynthesis protein [Streptomyces sp. NPDC094049]|uniref:PhzF family phenazine biosynthesis protein n=1 Tax=Streptomyces sp. NPDC094049 TaxID=3154987 RepID=UPI0033280901
MTSLPRIRPFMQVDVFSARPFHGNPVAVVLDGTGVSEERMQALARWTNLSETTFVLPPTNDEADYSLRIFTSQAELPFAGHPTLGTARAWLEAGGTPRRAGRIVQECAAGLVTVRHQDEDLAFAAPPRIRHGALDDAYLGRIMTAFGITRGQVLAHQWVDNGPGWAVVQLATAREVLDLEPELSLIPDAMVGAIGAHPAGGRYRYEMRTFAPGAGVLEDPACGSMSAGIAQWLTADGAAPAAYRVSQGSRVGRDASTAVVAEADGTVWVGGDTTVLIRGTITL